MTEESSTQITPVSDVFVSYASQDGAVANNIVEALETHGIMCWIAPRDVRPGTVYADAIVGAINEAKALVLVLSANAMPSAHVGREVERAASKRKQVIAFRVDATPLSRALEYFLSDSQWIDVPKLGMPAALGALTAAVRQGPATAPQPVLVVRSAGVSKRNVVIVAAVVGMGVAVAVGMHFWSMNHSGPQTTAGVPSHGAQAKSAPSVAISDKSIAVLPFADMSEKHDQEYFADGLADELLNTLVAVPGLRVIGRTSSFQFKGKSEDLRSIGTMLGAAHIVEGSVRRSSDHVRVTAQLIRSSDGEHEWSGTYDRKVTDLLPLQIEIATGLARALQISVADVTGTVPIKVNSAEAYELYLRGIHAMNDYSRDGFREAADDFQRTIELDPQFVRAHEMLAMVHQVQAADGFVSGDTGFAQVQEDVAKILKLDPKSAAAHALMARVHMLHTWDWPAAERESEAALALAPYNWGVLYAGAELAIALGRFGEAEKLLSTSINSDPLNPDSHGERSIVLLRLGRLKEAEAEARRCLAIAPTYVYGHSDLATVLMGEGRFAEALHEFEQEAPEADQLTGMAMAYHALGRERESKASLEKAIREQGTDQPNNIASTFAYLGQNVRAFEWLDRAYRRKDPLLLYVQADWGLQHVATDARYKAFLRKMNLPDQ